MLGFLFTMCSITDTIQDRIEQYLQLTEIRYCMWWDWPACYDCSWILTAAYRSVWYKYHKLASWRLIAQCKRKKFLEAKRGDILVLGNDPRHVAYITRWHKNGSVVILDYFQSTKAEHRLHGNFEWTIICDGKLENLKIQK